jgi:DNA-directed RNA polymerase subunit RPC12/RpoP
MTRLSLPKWILRSPRRRRLILSSHQGSLISGSLILGEVRRLREGHDFMSYCPLDTIESGISRRGAQPVRGNGIMIQRQCPECGSELVLARRPDNQQEPGTALRPSTYWRCSICGRGFTAEQIRESKRAKSSIEHA